VVELSFTSALNDKLVGFYRSTYVDEASGETRLLAVTQFEDIHARRAFPCLDEPNMKAVFNIKLGHPGKHLKVCCNNTMIVGSFESHFLQHNKVIFKKVYHLILKHHIF
jgi:aminopeptidase N